MKKKLTPEEISKIQDFQNQESKIIQLLGELSVKKILLNKQEDIVKEEIFNLQKEQEEFSKNLNETYGNGNINLETGEFESI